MFSKCLFLVLSLVASLGLAMPGGYMAKGGVMELGYTPHYMRAAEHAGKMAMALKIEKEAAADPFNFNDHGRGARQAPQDVVFFTNVQAEPHRYQQVPVQYHAVG